MAAYLIQYSRSTGEVVFARYESLADATRERLRLDKLNDDPDKEIVSVSAQDEESLRQSHSRYFSGHLAGV